MIGVHGTRDQDGGIRLPLPTDDREDFSACHRPIELRANGILLG